MVIEDSEACQLLLQALLSKWNVDVTFFTDAESALGAMRRFSPDLVFVDLVLPEMDGVAAIGAIRGMGGFESTPIVVTTSVNESALSVEARDVGASTYMVKPVTEEALATVLERFGAQR